MGRVEGCSGRGVAVREDEAIDTSVGAKVPLRRNTGRSARPGAKIILMHLHKAVFSGKIGEFIMQGNLPAALGSSES